MLPIACAAPPEDSGKVNIGSQRGEAMAEAWRARLLDVFKARAVSIGTFTLAPG
jgi:hypothetical protein